MEKQKGRLLRKDTVCSGDYNSGYTEQSILTVKNDGVIRTIMAVDSHYDVVAEKIVSVITANKHSNNSIVSMQEEIQGLDYVSNSVHKIKARKLVTQKKTPFVSKSSSWKDNSKKKRQWEATA